MLHPLSNTDYMVCKCDIVVVEMLAFWCLHCSNLKKYKPKNKNNILFAYQFINAEAALISLFRVYCELYIKNKNGQTGRIFNAE